MERSGWLDEGTNPADACFLMLTAITHHQFSSLIWDEREVRKLYSELAELDRLAAQAVVDRRSRRLGARGPGGGRHELIDPDEFMARTDG